MADGDFYTDKYPTQLAALIGGGEITLHSHPGGGSLPAGLICMWSGLLANIPAGWALCDGAGGRPDLRSKFVRGAAAGVEPGVTGGAATHTHDDHPALTHTGGAVDAHSGAGVDAHSAHAGAGVDAHSAHTTHAHELPFIKAAGGTGAMRLLPPATFGTGTSRTPETTTPALTAYTTPAAVELSESVVVAAHADHVFTQAANHAAHVFTQAAAHVFTQPNQHAAQSHVAANSEPAYYSLAYIIKT